MYNYSNYNYSKNNRNRYGGYGGYNNYNVDEGKIRRDFMNYADPKTRCIPAENFEKMGKDLGIDIYSDMFMMYFSYKCGCKKLDTITEDEFIQGLKFFGCNSLKEVKSKISETRGELYVIDSEDFKNFYYFLFDINVDAEKEIDRKTKRIPYEIVEIYFNGLFTSQFPVIKEFLEFLKIKSEKNKKLSGLIWDEWRVFLDFVQKEAIKFPKNYNVADYYPIVVDDFYRYYCKKHKIPIPEDDED